MTSAHLTFQYRTLVLFRDLSRCFPVKSTQPRRLQCPYARDVGHTSIQHLFDVCISTSNNYHIQVRFHYGNRNMSMTFCFNRGRSPLPYRLPYFNPFHSLRVLLTPTELRKPWILYLTPGLLAAELLHICYVVIALRALRHLLLPSLSQRDDSQPLDLSPRSLIVYLATSLFSTAILCPLEVISTRLAVQRNHESGRIQFSCPGRGWGCR